MYYKVSYAVLSKTAKTVCFVEQTQNNRVYRFSVISPKSDATDAKNMAVFAISD